MRIAVAGATGALGRHVVAQLEEAGHEAVPLSRSTGTDLTAPDAARTLPARLEGADAVIDVSGTNVLSSGASRAFFGNVTRTLLAAEREAGVPHHVAVSIVGAARVPVGYYASKALQEEIVTAQEGAGGCGTARCCRGPGRGWGTRPSTNGSPRHL